MRTEQKSPPICSTKERKQRERPTETRQRSPNRHRHERELCGNDRKPSTHEICVYHHLWQRWSCGFRKSWLSSMIALLNNKQCTHSGCANYVWFLFGTVPRLCVIALIAALPIAGTACSAATAASRISTLRACLQSCVEAVVLLAAMV